MKHNSKEPSTYFIYLSGSDLIESIAFWTSKLRMFCSFIKSTKSSPLYIEMSFLMSSFSWRYCRVLLLLKPPLTDYLDPVFSSIMFFLEPVLLCSRCGLRFFNISSRLWRSSSIGSAGLFDLALVFVRDLVSEPFKHYKIFFYQFFFGKLFFKIIKTLIRFL